MYKLSNKKIRVLIIDDSLVFRTQIQLALKENSKIEIVGTACNGQVAIDLMLKESIDICTLDIEMPILDGIGTLKEMKRLGIKTKAIMFSSLTTSGAEKTFEALKLGAIDFVAKPQSEDINSNPSVIIRSCLVPKILSTIRLDGKYNSSSDNEVETRNWNLFIPEVLVIASSTGGPNALVDLFSNLRDPLPFPILVTQHMPPVFTASLAERLGAYSDKISREAVDGEILKPNQIYVAPGNYHMSLSGDRKKPQIVLDQGEPRNFVRPCADFLFESASAIYKRGTLGVVLTGMGRDGADGAKAIKSYDGAVLIQNQESCVVFGMPGAVHYDGHYDFSGTPEDLAKKIIFISRPRRNKDAA